MTKEDQVISGALSRTSYVGLRHSRPATHAPRRRAGTILVTAMWALVVFSGLILVFARSTRVELSATANRVSSMQAAAVEHGAEQYVLSLVETAAGDPSTIVDAPAETMQVGDGYFWLIKPNPDDDQTQAFGLVDEASKLSLNAAPLAELLKLPGITTDVADSILDWRDPDSTVTDQGAEDDYYGQLPQPYKTKNDAFETVEELRLVKGMTEDMLWGLDRNHDGVLDARERAYGGDATAFNAANGAGKGIASYLTVYSVEASAGGNLANVNSPVPQPVIDALTKPLGATRAGQIVGTARPLRPYISVFDFCAKGSMTVDEVKKTYKLLTATTTTAKTIVGRTNINTASREVLACLSGIEQQDVDSLLSKRGTSTGTDLSWVYEALGPQKAAQVGARLTGKSYQYSADILAVAGNGRSFKRVRIVVDGRSTPAKIVFRKDLTELGWPLDDTVRQTLRNGGKLDTPIGTGGGVGTIGTTGK
jgi:type II secretory pathway component PulK